jgi:kynureninase
MRRRSRAPPPDIFFPHADSAGRGYHAPVSDLSRDAYQTLDDGDPLASFRARFAIPEGVLYLDGNSLGPLSFAAADRVERTLAGEWGVGLIRSWNSAGWIDLPRKVARKIAPLIGASTDEVAVSDSTSVNLFKLVSAALRLRPGRRIVLSEPENFPTDLYIADGAARSAGARVELLPIDRLLLSIDGDTALVMLTHIDFKTGRVHDLERITRAAHANGALVLWDLSHSIGAMPLDLSKAGADLAVGCTYKYLNGGPGSPAFAFVAARHHGTLESPLTGWMGHARPFDFAPAYAPARGIDRLLCGTPPVLSLAALDAAIDVFAEVDMTALRKKSMALGDRFIALVEARCARWGLELASPRDAAMRGSQVSFRHPESYALKQALIARNVIGDFRAPDIIRFGFGPLYIRFADIWDAVDALERVLAGREWDRPEHRAREAVT